MGTYAIGDVQGCWRTLRRLLDRLDLDPARDRLWLVGDLVNRGAGSLEVLRWARGLGDGARVVLGNHDLHLLGCAAGLRRQKAGDTLDAVLRAPDRGDLLAWLRARPLLVREEVAGRAHVLVHAGLLPAWSLDEAAARAAEAEALLRAPGSEGLALAFGRGARRGRGPGGGPGAARAAEALAALTRLRFVDASGRMDDDGADFKGPPADAPPGLVPWFDAPSPRDAAATVVFGHWAALDLLVRPGLAALDTGCVWGRRLTALRLEDGALWHEPTDPLDLPARHGRPS